MTAGRVGLRLLPRRRSRRCVPHRRLHDALRVPHVLRRVPRPRPPARVASRAITVPLIILAVFAVLAGFLNAAAVRRREVRRVGRAHGSRSPSSCTPSSTTRRAIISRVDRGARHRHRRVLLVPARGARRAQGPHGAQQGSRTPGYTFLDEQVLPRRPVRERHRGVDQGRRSPTRRYWVNQHVIDGVVNGAGRGARVVGRFTYDDARPEGRRRRGQRHRRDHRRERRPPALRPVGSRAAVRAAPVRRGRAPEPRPALANI